MSLLEKIVSISVSNFEPKAVFISQLISITKNILKQWDDLRLSSHVKGPMVSFSMLLLRPCALIAQVSVDTAQSVGE